MLGRGAAVVYVDLSLFMSTCRCLCRLVVVDVDLSRLKGFYLHFAPQMRCGVTGNWSDDIWKLNGGNYRFHSDQNNRMCVHFSCVERAN